MEIYKKERYTMNGEEAQFKQIASSNIKKVENQTFDDLWDWRLTQGNLFTGKELKGSINIYQGTDKGFTIGKESARALQSPMSRITNNLNQENKNKDSDSEEDDEKNEGKKDLEDLIKMASLNADQITKEYGKKAKKRGNKGERKKSELGGQGSRTGSKKNSRTQGHLPPINKGTKNEMHDISFEISDDEEKDQKKVTVSVKPNADALKRFRIAKNIIKNAIQRKKQLNQLRTPNPFDDVKADEDFQTIGNVVIGQQDFKTIPGKKSDQLKSIDLIPVIPVVLLNQKKDENTDLKEQEDAAEKEKNEENIEKDLEIAIEAGNLQNNPAFKVIAQYLSGKNNVFTNNKKRKKNKETDEEKKTPEELEEEAIVKYYQKSKYEFLKLESHYTYDTIPPPAFNSILDILPIKVQVSKKSIIDKEIKMQSDLSFLMKYTMVELRKKKQKKKKGKKKEGDRKSGKPSSKSDMMNSASFGANSSMGDQEGSGGSLSEASDGGSLYGEDSDGIDVKKGSQVKQNRKMFFLENEKYIVRKPFPLSEQNRKNAILVDMKTDTGMKIKKNQVSSISKTRKKMADLQAEFQVVKDNMEADQIEDEKEKKEAKTKEVFSNYEGLYMKVRSQDTKIQSIERFNWSGNQIMQPNSFTLTQTEKSLDSLNLQKLDIWMKGWNGFYYTVRRYTREFVDSSPINLFLMFSVFFNTLILASDGLTPTSWDSSLSNINLGFTVIFTSEAVLKIFGYGIRNYLRDYFNDFDLFVVIISLVEVVINSLGSGSGGNAASAFKVVRIFRIFRVLRVSRLLRSLKFMKVIIEVIKDTLEQFTYIAILMFLFVFIFTLLGTQIFGGNFTFMKSYKVERFNFDSFSSAFYTAFVILTMENWNAILYSCLRASVSPVISLLYLLSWIFIGNYIFLNLFLAILLEGFESSDALQMAEEIEEESKELDRIHKELIKDMEEKKKNEEIESQKATEKVFSIIEPEKYIDKQEARKNKATYMVARNVDQDNESLSEEIDLKAHINKGFLENKVIIDPYKDIDCTKSLFYFSKSNKFRLLCAKIVSHPKFETVVLVLIVTSSIKLVVETYWTPANGTLGQKVTDNIDRAFTIMFAFESLVKIVRNGFFVAKSAYLRETWSQLDFFIVVTSLIDTSVESVDISILKVLRLLRTLRPLRFISQNQNMRIVVNALLESMIAILNVLIVIGMVWVMFAILGSNLMQGKMSTCLFDTDISPYGISQQDCAKYGGTWKNAYWNFDNIVESMVTLYVLSTMEGWPNVLGSMLDANSATEGPIFNGSPINGVFCIVFILLGSLFLMNLFVGVIFVQFSEEQRKEKESRFYMVTDNQMRWMMVQELVVRAKPNFDVMLRPKGKLRIFFFRMINSKIFETTIMGFIMLNILSMGFAYESMSTEYTSILNYVNIGFTVVFILEFVFKIIALDFQYFTSSWNNFDFSIVILSRLV